MFKKLKIAGLFLTSAILLAACGDSGGNSSSGGDSGSNNDKTYTLTFNNFEPAGGNIDKNILSKWETFVEEKTEGRVDIDIQHGGVLGPPTTVQQDLEAGLFDLGFIIPSYSFDTKFFPYSIGTLPFAAENPRQIAEALKEFTNETLDFEKEFPKLKVYDPVSSDAYDIASKEPIDFSKLSGKKMRASSTADSEYVKALGGSPVGLKINEVYEGLQKGTIDISFVAPTHIEAYRTYEVAPYIKRINYMFSPLVPALNREAYEKLPEDLQKMFDEELMPELVNLAIETYEKIGDETYKNVEGLLGDKGEIADATDAELTDLRAKSKASWESWIKDANDRGYDGEKFVETYFNILKSKNIPTPY